MSGSMELESHVSKLKLLELEFFDKHCKKCMGTPLQNKRKCAKIYGHDFLACDKQECFIHRRTKNDRERIAKELVEKVQDSAKGARTYGI